MRVYIYRNLRTKTWSVRHAGKVIAHPEEVLIRNADFQVSEPGRQRVLAERRKNVHAFVTAASLEDVSFFGEPGLGVGKTSLSDRFAELRGRLLARPGDSFPVEPDGEPPFDWEEVLYNPYKYETFIRMSGGAAAPPSRWVYMTAFDQVFRSRPYSVLSPAGDRGPALIPPGDNKQKEPTPGVRTG